MVELWSCLDWNIPEEPSPGLEFGATKLDWCCFYYIVRKSLVALLEALCAQLLLTYLMVNGICEIVAFTESFTTTEIGRNLVILARKPPDLILTCFQLCSIWLMLLLLLRKLQAICARIFFLDSWISGFSDIFFLVCARSLTKPFFRPYQPGSRAWLSPFLLWADCTCVLVCVCLCMCMYKCVGKLINI